MKRTKLTTTEKRALALCESFKKHLGGIVTVEWKPSKMYGNNPVISYHNEKCCNVSGCGYDKLSTALGEVLRFLAPIDSPAHMDIWTTGGVGESATMRSLAKVDWQLKTLTKGKTFDVYELTYTGARIIRADGSSEIVSPANGENFTLEECQKIVGGYVERLYITGDRFMLVNEEGKIHSLPLNDKATALYPNDSIVGDVLICKPDQFR